MTKTMKLELAPQKSEVGIQGTSCTVAHRQSDLEQLKDFAQHYGHDELRSLSKVNDILHEIRLRAPKYQKTVTVSFLPEIHIVTLKAFPRREFRSN